jgi:chromosome segregation ATPase
MKFKDIVHKGSVKPKSDYKVIMGDTPAQRKLEEEITTLKSGQVSFDALKKENEDLQEQIKFLKELSSDQQASMYELGKNFSNEVTNLAEYAVLKEKFDRLSKDFMQVENSYTTATQSKEAVEKELANRQNRDELFNLTIDKLKTEVGSLGAGNSELETIRVSLSDRIELLEGEAIKLKNTIDTQSSDLVEVSTGKNNLDIEHNKLLANHQAVKKTNKTAISRVKLLETQTEQTEERFIEVSNVAKQATMNLKETTKDLELSYKQYNELRKDTEFLWTKMQHLQQEASKPRYTSLSSIERSEGFKLPRNLIAPKNFLGHGKPTLLKVRAS